MPLKIGDVEATSGMAGAIYLEIDGMLRPSIEDKMAANGAEPEEIKKTILESRESWQKLSYALAAAVVKYLRRDPPTSEPTETEYAEAFSSPAEDATFWNWLNGFVAVFETWASEPTSNATALKTMLKEHLTESRPPEELKGVVR